MKIVILNWNEMKQKINKNGKIERKRECDISLQ